MFSFFPLEIILVTTHLTSDLLSSFLDLFQPPFSAVSLSWYHLKVNEADLLPGENTVWTFYTLWLRTIHFQCLCPVSVSGVVSCPGFSLVTLIKIIALAFEKSNICRDLLWLPPFIYFALMELVVGCGASVFRRLQVIVAPVIVIGVMDFSQPNFLIWNANFSHSDLFFIYQTFNETMKLSSHECGQDYSWCKICSL